MRFSHTADCHVGGHRDPRLRQLTEEAFERFVRGSIEESVDFAIIAGDLFNTAIPGIDTLKFVVTQLGRLKAHDIPVYAIPGSHDFSPSGKTMLDVLEEAGLLRNVCRGTVGDDGRLKLAFTTDAKTKAKLTGIIGKRGMLDRHIYEDLDRSIEREPGKKIFLFHTAISELKPKELQEVDAQPISFLPKGFVYYAGGHVHVVERYAQEGYANVVYPGPLFPNSFSELEHLKHGGYYVYDDVYDDDDGEEDDDSAARGIAAGAPAITRREIILKEVVALRLDADGRTAEQANAELLALAQETKATDAIVLLRIEGTLSGGSPADVDTREAVRRLEERGAYIVLRNTARLASPEFAAVQLRHDEPRQIEESLLFEQADDLKVAGTAIDGASLTRELLRTLSQETAEGERLTQYEERVTSEAMRILDAHAKGGGKAKDGAEGPTDGTRTGKDRTG